MRAGLARTGLFFRTLTHLHPEQVAHRARLRSQRFLAHRAPGVAARLLARPIVTAPGWPEAFRSLDERVAEGFPDPSTNAAGRFEFLGESRSVDDDWAQREAERLWRFHLHYFEWAWAFTRHPDQAWARREFARLWSSWSAASRPGVGDAWSPYVASLRAWVMCGVHRHLVRGSDIEEDFLTSLGVHARFIRSHLELDVRGNHLLKNVKALFGLAVFLGDLSLDDKARRLLRRELRSQVLGDGGHYERSPSYHAQVLGDLIDIRDLMAAAGYVPPDGIGDTIETMRAWLAALLLPDGDVPLFNDCVSVGRNRLAMLGVPKVRAKRLDVLKASGYLVVRTPRLHLVADVGLPCPPELPAHAHADCLSFVLAVDGRPVVVDTGTSTYEAGARRLYERSTAAHNTVDVDGHDQTEVWGVFRAGRLAVPRIEDATDADGVIVIVASHDGYTRLPGSPRHRRTWRIADESVTITDEVTGSGVHTVAVRFHIASEAADVLDVRVVDAPTRCERTDVASNFGCLRPAHVIVAEATTELPMTITTTLTPRILAGTR